MSENRLKSSSRNECFDALRFLLIVAIYVGHYGTTAGKLYPFVFTYHIELFFIMAGFWALKKVALPVKEFFSKSIIRYVFPWFLWVLVYTMDYSIRNSFNVTQTLEIFKTCFFAIKAETIGGMWFPPCFFIVACVYWIMAKVLSLLKRSELCNAVVLSVVAFAVYYVAGKLFPTFEREVFTLHRVPMYLFYYALGPLIYRAYAWLKEKTSGRRMLYRTTAAAAFLVSAGYMVLVYFQKHTRLWEWMAFDKTKLLSFVPEVLLLVCALILHYFAAKLCVNRWTVWVGRATLTLCCAEMFVKRVLVNVFSMIGLEAAAKNPLQAILFSLLAIAVAMYTVVPFTDKLMNAVVGFFIPLKKVDK